MAWPSLTACVKSIDVSRYDNWRNGYADYLRGRVNWPAVAAQHPEIKHVCVRLAGASSGVDPDFAYNYDEAEAAGFKVSLYVNQNPARTVASLVLEWKAGLGSRSPKMVTLDSETMTADKALNTRHQVDCMKAVEDMWPDAFVDVYTAPWCWNNAINHGIEGGWKLWDAGYPYFVMLPDGKYRVAWAFEEVDPLLPISNNFTPGIPQGWVLEQCGRWQFTDKAMLYPITQVSTKLPRADLNYMLRSLYDSVWGETPPAPPAPTPVTVEVRHPANVTIRDVVV